MLKTIWKYSLLLALVLMAGPALAQDAQDTRGVPVTERPRPDYDALGIRAGAFLIKPELTLGLEYNDNIYATKDNKESDIITLIAPNVDFLSNWSRHALGGSVGAAGGIYGSNPDENYLDAYLLMNGRVDVLRESFMDVALGAMRLHEERGAPDARAGDKEPVVYYRSMADLAYNHGLGRTSLRGGLGVTNYSFQSVKQLDGTTRDPGDERNRNQYNLNARLGYELLPNVQPFAAGRYEWRRYDKKEAARDSDGYRIGLGTGFDLGGVTTGEIYGGYMRQDYKDAGRKDISAPWYGLSLLWNVTQMTSIQAEVEKSVKETTLVGASGIDAIDLGLRLDHELLRNLLAGVFFDYTHDDYKGVTFTNTYTTFGPRLTYLWNRNFNAELEYAHRRKDSDLSSTDYTENRFTISVTGKF